MRARLVVLALAFSLPARAQWTRVASVPVAEVGALLLSGTTLYAGALDAVYTSRAGGTSWTRSAPLPTGVDGVWALAEHNGRLFAGCYGGVLESTDGGETWIRFNAGIGGISEVAFTVVGSRVYALATRLGRGSCTPRTTPGRRGRSSSGPRRRRRSTPQSSTATCSRAGRTGSGSGRSPRRAERAGPAGLALRITGPNPVRSATTIALALGEASEARVEVYDALGRHVATLYQGTFTGGEHQFPLDASALAPGLYIVRAVVGAEVSALRVVVSR